MLLSDFVKEGTAALERLYPSKEARNIVLVLCEDILGTKSYTHIVEPQFEIPAGKESLLKEALDRLEKGEPVQYVTGKAMFQGRCFNVGPDVLIPRPETELLCREAVKVCSRIQRMRLPYGKNATPVRVLDLCTGSGCIAWTVALSVPGVRVVGVDISEGALNVASGQDFSVEMKSSGALRPEFLKADVLGENPDFPYREFDVVLSNPPYIMESEKALMRSNVLDYEPSLALFVPDGDPLVFYRAISAWSISHLAPEGIGMTEVNESLARETAGIFRDAGYGHVEIVKDFNERNRFVTYCK
ncbi:MAG: peptide chain release factor N(5)-glutamine methyltransferase [Candidatus Cryptobacteroides sp.]